MRYTKVERDAQLVLDAAERSSLRTLLIKAKWLLALNKILQTILPETFRAHVSVMNVQHATLILSASNAAIATRIQFLSSSILSELKKHPEYAKLNDIRCKVTPI